MQLSGVTRHVLYTLGISLLFDSTQSYLGIGSPYLCLKVSGDWGGRLGADLKKSSLAPLFFLTANKRLPSFTQTAYCRRREALASKDPPGKSVAPLKACSTPHWWHDRFPPSLVTWRIGIIEAQYWKVCERNIHGLWYSVITAATFCSLINCCCSLCLLFSIKPWKSLCCTLPLENLGDFTSVYNVKKSSWWS